MAKQKRRGSRRKAHLPVPAVAPPAVNVRILVDMPDGVASYYVNHAEIAHSRHEFSIVVAKTPTKVSASRLEEAVKTGVIKVEPVLQLVIPVTMMPGLIKACTAQREKYEAAYGPIREGAEEGNQQ